MEVSSIHHGGEQEDRQPYGTCIKVVTRVLKPKPLMMIVPKLDILSQDQSEPWNVERWVELTYASIGYLHQKDNV